MRGLGAGVLAALMLCGCASTPDTAGENDPIEPANRAVYKFDQVFDQYVVLPVAGVYVIYMPPPLRHGLHNVLTNLDLPVTFTNDVLQGEFKKAGKSLGRFAFNTTVGLGGIVDVATPAGLAYEPADFGQTLGRYGFGEGPFLVLPFIGPDPPRDLIGDAADMTIDPLMHLPPGAPFWERFTDTVVLHIGSPFEVHARNIVLRRELEKGSVDPYVTMRSVYRQLREEEISKGLPESEYAPPK
ncbi:MAG TPA: VacJ family lipoprotein [Rhizomicrobium sp.]|nr:VacJ family lipoprotein [Rhizomicrobium sp.]